MAKIWALLANMSNEEIIVFRGGPDFFAGFGIGVADKWLFGAHLSAVFLGIAAYLGGLVGGVAFIIKAIIWFFDTALETIFLVIRVTSFL